MPPSVFERIIAKCDTVVHRFSGGADSHVNKCERNEVLRQSNTCTYAVELLQEDLVLAIESGGSRPPHAAQHYASRTCTLQDTRPSGTRHRGYSGSKSSSCATDEPLLTRWHLPISISLQIISVTNGATCWAHDRVSCRTIIHEGWGDENYEK